MEAGNSLESRGDLMSLRKSENIKIVTANSRTNIFNVSFKRKDKRNKPVGGSPYSKP